MPKSTRASNYPVGYKRPPAEHRFKKGQSGNPKGRKAGTKNITSLLSDLLEQTKVIELDGRPQRVSVLEAIVRRLVARALKGDHKAFLWIAGLQADYADAETSAVQIPRELKDMSQKELSD